MDGDVDNTSPELFTNYVYKWLEVALDCGIKEYEFWDMTLAEITRAVDSYNRKKKREEQEKASYDYILADMIGRSVARLFNGNNRFPEIYTVYPTLFDNKEIQEREQQARMEMSVIRFKQFAQAYNQKRGGKQ